jgi:hypothetical protein
MFTVYRALMAYVPSYLFKALVNVKLTVCCPMQRLEYLPLSD